MTIEQETALIASLAIILSALSVGVLIGVGLCG